MGEKSMKLEIFEYRRKTVLKYQELFQKFVERIIKEYKGKVSILLFGSRARGDNRMSSDFDVLIILERGDLMNHYLRILKLKPLELPVDLVIIYPSDLKKPIIRKMIQESKIIYDGLKILNQNFS